MTHQTLLAIMALVPVSLLPLVAGYASPLYGLAALILGAFFADCAARFVVHRSPAAARQLLLASIAYLPLVFTLLVLPGSAIRLEVIQSRHARRAATSPRAARALHAFAFLAGFRDHQEDRRAVA